MNEGSSSAPETICGQKSIQCTGISLHTKLKCLRSLAHLYKMLVLSTWTLHILYNNVYRHFLLIYWAQFKMLQTLPRHDWKSTKNGHFAHPWESAFSDLLRLFTFAVFSWHGIGGAVGLGQINFLGLILRNCWTEHQIVATGGSRNVAVFCTAERVPEGLERVCSSV